MGEKKTDILWCFSYGQSMNESIHFFLPNDFMTSALQYNQFLFCVLKMSNLNNLRISAALHLASFLAGGRVSIRIMLGIVGKLHLLFASIPV